MMDIHKKALEIVEIVQDNFGLPVGAPEMLRLHIAQSLTAAHAAGIEEAAKRIERYPGRLAGKRTEQLTQLAAVIRALLEGGKDG